MLLSFGQGMALLRIGFGLYFLVQGLAKLAGNWLVSAEPLLNSTITPAIQRGTAEPYYRPFLENVVVPNGLVFSQLVVFGEILVGLSLLLGLFTRLGAIGGAWLNINYMLMKGLLNGAGSNDRLFLLAEIVFFLVAAGLVWGLDGRLRELWAGNAVTRWVAGLSGPRAEQMPST